MARRRLGRAIGVQGAAQAIGLSVGPSVGGLLIDALGWRWVFFIAVPFGLLGTIVGWLVLPTTRRGAEAMDYSYALMDLTVYGRQEPWEDSPPGWPQQCSITRTKGGSPAWPPLSEWSEWPGGRPIAQWPRLEAGRSDDLRCPSA